MCVFCIKIAIHSLCHWQQPHQVYQGLISGLCSTVKPCIKQPLVSNVFSRMLSLPTAAWHCVQWSSADTVSLRAPLVKVFSVHRLRACSVSFKPLCKLSQAWNLRYSLLPSVASLTFRLNSNEISSCSSWTFMLFFHIAVTFLLSPDQVTTIDRFDYRCSTARP